MGNKISIIVPVYNVEKYLEKCVDSIINQTHLNIEIILINDGSIDSCGKLCDNYKRQDNRIIVIHQNNQGLSEARNKGIEMSTGDYLGFVDSDDWIEKDMFELLYTNLIQFDADISMCGYSRMNEDNSIISKYLYDDNKRIEILSGKNIMKHYLFDYTQKDKICNVVWNKLYKRHIFKDIRFPENKIYEDVFTTYLLLDKAKKMVISPELKYNYLIRNNSIMNQPVSINIFNIIEGNIKRYDYVKFIHPEFEPSCRKLFLIDIIYVLSKISDYKTVEIYKKQMDDLIDIIKKIDIYTCGLSDDNINMLELFMKGNKEWFLAMKLYKKIASRK